MHRRQVANGGFGRCGRLVPQPQALISLFVSLHQLSVSFFQAFSGLVSLTNFFRFGSMRPTFVCGQQLGVQKLRQPSSLPWRTNAASFDHEAVASCCLFACRRVVPELLLTSEVPHAEDPTGRPPLWATDEDKRPKRTHVPMPLCGRCEASYPSKWNNAAPQRPQFAGMLATVALDCH